MIVFARNIFPQFLLTSFHLLNYIKSCLINLLDSQKQTFLLLFFLLLYLLSPSILKRTYSKFSKLFQRLKLLLPLKSLETSFLNPYPQMYITVNPTQNTITSFSSVKITLLLPKPKIFTKLFLLCFSFRIKSAFPGNSTNENKM